MSKANKMACSNEESPSHRAKSKRVAPRQSLKKMEDLGEEQANENNNQFLVGSPQNSVCQAPSGGLLAPRPASNLTTLEHQPQERLVDRVKGGHQQVQTMRAPEAVGGPTSVKHHEENMIKPPSSSESRSLHWLWLRDGSSSLNEATAAVTTSNGRPPIGAISCKSKAAAASSSSNSTSTSKLLSSLPLCLVLFALSLFSSTTTTTLVNGIRLQPEGKEKVYWSGEQFVITCQNNNNIKNVKIRWTDPEGKPVTENRKERIHVESYGHRLVVNNAQLNGDDGRYTCSFVEGQRVRESAEFTLRVLKETSFGSTQRHATLKAGSRGQLDCHVQFDPSVTSASVAWFKNQQPVDLLNDTSLRVVDYDLSHQMSSLIIQPVKREHEDEYTCQATAVTQYLSKITDHKIQVETQFGPIFDAPEQTIWVESIQALNGRLHNSQSDASQTPPAAAAAAAAVASSNPQPFPGPTGRHSHQASHRNLSNVSNRNAHLRQQAAANRIQSTSGGASSNSQEQVVRVELKCTCQANPDANILWFASSQNYAIVKGSPEQVVEEPSQERSGHNVTSILVVSYNLDPNWDRRRERYKCSASNLLATAEKFYTIEQGNPPPAFRVGPASYSPETSVFNFTLIGPEQTSNGGDGATSQPANIVPPVDAFRISAESSLASGAAGAPAGSAHMDASNHFGRGHKQHSAAHVGSARRQTDHSVQLAYTLGPDVSLPLNMSVKLGHLPSGTKRLFLEAHNAVGYSLTPTYLGEFNLVSSAFTISASLNGQTLFILLTGQLFILASYLVRTPQHHHHHHHHQC